MYCRFATSMGRDRPTCRRQFAVAMHSYEETETIHAPFGDRLLSVAHLKVRSLEACRNKHIGHLGVEMDRTETWHGMRPQIRLLVNEMTVLPSLSAVAGVVEYQITRIRGGWPGASSTGAGKSLSLRRGRNTAR